jgi:predicted transcriptional regulator
MADTAPLDLTTLTVDLLCAYVASTKIDGAMLPDLIRTTHAALRGLDVEAVGPATLVEPVPAVGIRKSLASPDHILSMIDGKPYKTLKRHLTSHGLTPAAYRDRFRLPADYPMVSKGYSATRSAVATRLGLGRSAKIGGSDVVEATPDAAAAPAPAADAGKPVPRRAPLKLRLSGGAAAPRATPGQ